LVLFYNIFFSNLGLAIIAFSLFLRIILNPLTKPAIESAKKIREIQPQINKLKKKYKDDKQGFLKAQSELYKQNGINPGAGCLPQVLQLVILIAFYNAFRQLLNGHGVVPEGFNNLLYAPLKFAQDAHVNTQFLYLDVSLPDKFNIPGLPFALPGLFVILAAVSQFVSAKISMPYVKEEEQVAEKTKDQMDDTMVAMQSSMIYTFPLMTLLIGLSLPSGLALYWLVFSVQQAYSQYKSFGWGGMTSIINKIKRSSK
jgi:YidC/Oxa1 family membrane protein insertase